MGELISRILQQGPVRPGRLFPVDKFSRTASLTWLRGIGSPGGVPSASGQAPSGRRDAFRKQAGDMLFAKAGSNSCKPSFGAAFPCRPSHGFLSYAGCAWRSLPLVGLRPPSLDRFSAFRCNLCLTLLQVRPGRFRIMLTCIDQSCILIWKNARKSGNQKRFIEKR